MSGRKEEEETSLTEIHLLFDKQVNEYSKQFAKY